MKINKNKYLYYEPLMHLGEQLWAVEDEQQGGSVGQHAGSRLTLGRSRTAIYTPQTLTNTYTPPLPFISTILGRGSNRKLSSLK